MKTTTLILSLFVTVSSFSQEVFKLDSTLVQNWETSTDEWLDNFKNHYYYDNGGANDTRVYQFMYNNNWDSIVRETKSYSGNNLSETTFETYDGTQWNYTIRQELSYNPNNQVTLEENYVFAGSWLKDASQENTYDVSSGNITEELFKVLDFVSGQLINDKKNLFDYYPNDLLEQETFQNWLSNMWVNQTRRDYFYLPNNLVDYIDRFDWLGSAWSAVKERSLFFYNGDDLVSEVRVQTESGSTLVNDSRVLNTYDDSPNLTQVRGQTWNGSAWDNVSNLIQNYDADDNIEEQITQIWNVSDDQWLNQIRLLSYWSQTESLSVSFNEVLNVNAYPNPTTDILRVQLSSLPKNKFEAFLFDVSGRQIHRLNIDKGKTYFEMPMAQQALGTYILKIKSLGETQTFRIIKN